MVKNDKMQLTIIVVIYYDYISNKESRISEIIIVDLRHLFAIKQKAPRNHRRA